MYSLLILIAIPILWWGISDFIHKARFFNAPMAIEIYNYLKHPIGTEDREVQLAQISKKHIPINSSVAKAINIFENNHFTCGGSYRISFERPQNEREYACGIENIEGNNIFVSSVLTIYIQVKDYKIINYRAVYSLYGL